MASFIHKEGIKKPTNSRKSKIMSQKPSTSDKIKYFKFYEQNKDYVNKLTDRIKDIDTSCNTIFELLKDIRGEYFWYLDTDKKIVKNLFYSNFLNEEEEDVVYNLIRESGENASQFNSILKMLTTLCENQKKNRIKLHKINSKATNKIDISTVKLKSLEPISELDEGGNEENKDYVNKLTDRIKDIDTSCNAIFELLKDIRGEYFWYKDTDKNIVLNLSRTNFLNKEELNVVYNLMRESRENALQFNSILKMLTNLCENKKENRITLHKINSIATNKIDIATSKLKSLEPISKLDEGGRRKRNKKIKRKSGKSTRRKKRKSGKSTRRKKRKSGKSGKSTRRKKRKSRN